MIKILPAICAVAAAVGLIAAAPASGAATPSGSTVSSKQLGYVAVPRTFHSAAVTVRVPTLSCTTKSRQAVQLGLFATETRAGAVRPVSVAVQASCRNGDATYRAVHNSGGGGLRVHHGDVVRLTLDGVESYSVEDRTTGAGEGGGGEVGPGTKPEAERPVLIGVQWVGARPTGLRADFTNPLVNHTTLAKVRHHKHGNTRADLISSLHDKQFRVGFSRSGAPA